MSTELDQLRTFRAADDAADPAACAAARGALLARIDAAAGMTPVAAVRPPRRRWLLAGGLSLAAAAAAAVALVVGVGTSGVRPERASAAELLRHAADVAAQGPDVVLAPGQYWYTRSENTMQDTIAGARTFTVQLHVRREAWIGRDGGGRVRQYSVGAPRFVGPHARADWIAEGRPSLGLAMDVPLTEEDGTIPQKTYHLGALLLTYAELRALPTDTDMLSAMVARQARRNSNAHGDSPEMFTIVGDLLREAPLPPALRAALFRVAARIPGVELVGETTDAAGRPGVAVSLSWSHARHELIFDAQTAALLGEREEGDGQIGFEAVYLASGAVDSTDARP